MYQLDAKDKKILYQLDMNARQSFSQIGKKVNLPKTVVNYRIKKLMKQGVVKNFYPVVDTFKLGYDAYRIYISFQYTNPLIMNEIFSYFTHYPLNWWTISSEGRFDLTVIVWVNHINLFYSYWEKTLQKYRDYFRNQQFSIYIQSYSFLNEYLISDPDFLEKKRKTFILSDKKNVTNLDKIDIDIIKQLAKNARISIRELSYLLHLSYNQVKKHLDEMIINKIILGFRADIDISILGYQYYKTDIYLKKYEDRSKIINYIIRNPHLIRIDKSVGISDLELEFHVKNNEEFHSIMHDLINKFHNSIKNYKYLTASEVHNMNYIPQNF